MHVMEIHLFLSDVEEILEKLGEDKEMVKESILINCTEQNEAQFSFDVGTRTSRHVIHYFMEHTVSWYIKFPSGIIIHLVLHLQSIILCVSWVR